MLTREWMAKTFLLIGVVSTFALGYLVWQRQQPLRLEFRGDLSGLSTRQPAEYKKPMVIRINDLQIDAPILPATIVKGKWEATDKGVSYLITSPVPGESGNSIIYGHNYPNILGRLVRARPGQKIVIGYDDGSATQFIIKYTATVGPEQTYILGDTSDVRLTIYTCAGFLDRKRFVVVAVPLVPEVGLNDNGDI